MTMQSRINKKAWNIRRKAANKYNCPIMEISWKECLRMAKEGCMDYLDRVCKAFTASKSFADLLTVNENYNPTMMVSRYPDMLVLANAFDHYMQAFNKPNRAFRSYNK